MGEHLPWMAGTNRGWLIIGRANGGPGITKWRWCV